MPRAGLSARIPHFTASANILPSTAIARFAAEGDPPFTRRRCSFARSAWVTSATGTCPSSGATWRRSSRRYPSWVPGRLLDVFGVKARDQITHQRRRARGVALRHRIFTHINLPAQHGGLRARLCDGPVGIAADGDAALAPARAVVQHERLRT